MSAKITDFAKYTQRFFLQYREETGQSFTLWATIALLSLLTQVVLHHVLFPGEFGTFNTALGAIGLMTVPLIVLSHAFTWHLARKHAPGGEERLERIRAAELVTTETFTWAWAIVSSVLVLLLLPLLQLPRYSLTLVVLLTVLIALGTQLSGTIYRSSGWLPAWTRLLVCAAMARLVLSMVLGTYAPWSESALAAFFIAGLITFAPVLRSSETTQAERIQALKTVMDRAFLIDLSAIFSVFLGTYLFTNADRIVAQSWFGTAADNNIAYVDWPMFDAYQTAGLLARSILWGTQPLLLVLFFRRSRLDHTTAASIDWFWLYLGALVTGVTFVDFFHVQLSWLFCGSDYVRTAYFIPGLTLTMIPLGLLQGIGIFGLASRRYPECFVFGACGLAYTLVLYFAGRHPQLMPVYMFGGGLVSLMIVLFVGIVRWGRKQP